MSAARRVVTALAALLTLMAGGIAQAGVPRLCEQGVELSAQQKDRRLQLVAQLKQELQRSGQAVALVARSGVDLARFELRDSHAGIALRDSPNTPWSVRQLYYACDEQRPRLFDQGLAGFLMSAEAPDLAYVSVVFLPKAPAGALRATAVDRARFAPLLAAQYSANAYPFSVRYQNCNQWVAELLATAWAPPDERATAPAPALRGRAQAWLQQTGYAPRPVTIDSHLTRLAAGFVPLVHLDDHPEQTRLGMVFQTSLPTDIEAWVHAQWPGARRLEFCHDTEQAVVRQGRHAIGEGCKPQPGDRVLRFAR